VSDPRAGAQSRYVELTADIVSAYVTKNSLRPADLPDLIVAVHAALRNVANPVTREREEKPTPIVNPKRTVTPDYLISLEDGRRYRSLKRHLQSRGLTPAQYRTKWDLPYDYPMIAINYSKARSEIAKKLGLGLRRTEANQRAGSATGRAAAPASIKARRKRE
jgi:predicted transcriptional regulator